MRKIVLCLVVAACLVSHAYSQRELTAADKDDDDDRMAFHPKVPTTAPVAKGTVTEQPVVVPSPPVPTQDPSNDPDAVPVAAPSTDTPATDSNPPTASENTVPTSSSVDNTPTSGPEVRTEVPTSAEPEEHSEQPSADTAANDQPTEEASAHPTTAASNPPTRSEEGPVPEPTAVAAKTVRPTIRPFLAQTESPTEKPTVEATDGTNKPTVEPTERTESPTVEKTNRPTLIPTLATDEPTSRQPVPTQAQEVEPEPVPDTGAPTRPHRPRSVEPTFHPTEETHTAEPTTAEGTGDHPKTPDNGGTGGGDGGGTDTEGEDAAADGAEAASYDRVSLMLFGAVIVMSAFVVYRYCCKAGDLDLSHGVASAVSGAVGGGGSGGGPSYSRLSTTEENVGFLDSRGDIEMSGGTHGAYDDNGDWEEWESSNEDPNPPRSAGTFAAPPLAPPLRSSSSNQSHSSAGSLNGGGGASQAVMKNSHSREDVSFNGGVGAAGSGSGKVPPGAGSLGTLGSSPGGGAVGGLRGGLKPSTGSAGGSATNLAAGAGAGAGAGGGASGGAGGAAGVQTRAGKARTSGANNDVDLFASIGIAAAPKFGQTGGLGSLSLNTANKSKTSAGSKSPTRAGSSIRAAASVSPTVGGGPSRVSAIRMTGSDTEGPSSAAAAGGAWDEDKELDDLIGDD